MKKQVVKEKSILSMKSGKLNDPPCNFEFKKSQIITSTLAINILSLALPIMVLQVYDRILANHSIGTLKVLVVGVTIVVVLEGILRIGRSYITAWAGMVYEYTLTSNAMRYFIHGDIAKMEKRGAGEHMQDIGSFAKLRDFYGGQALMTMVDIPFAVLFLALIGYLAGSLVLVPLILMVVFASTAWLLGNKLKKAIKAQGECDDKRYNFIVETLHGIHTVKSYGVESVFQRRYERMEEESSITNYNTAILSTRAYSLSIVFNEIMVVSVVTVGAPMVMSGHFTTGTLIASVLLSGRLMQPLQKALSLWTRFQDFRLASEKAKDIFSIPQVKKKMNLDTSDRSGTLEIKDMSFGYDDKLLFDNINLSLEPGAVISIGGDHNSGKSTLLRLIAGLYVPNSGSVVVDGTEVSKYKAEDLIDHVGFMSDEGVIFQGTILDNLTGFNDDKENKAFEIAELLKITDDIAMLPSGYDTVLNDGVADPIPPGLKQRITLARVLVNKPRVILFDNADRALDRDGYNYIVKLLTKLKGKATIILASGDHNIMRLADREYILENGALQEVDSHDSKIYDVHSFRELKI